MSFEGGIGGYDADEILIEGRRYALYMLSKLSFVVTVMAVGVGIPEIVAAGNDLVYETVLQTRSWCQDPPKYLYAGRRKA